MKKITVMALLVTGLFACTPPPSDTEQTTTDTTAYVTAPASQYDIVQLVFIADRSKSFITKYSYPDPLLFKPLADKISQSVTLDFRYGIIRDFSDITFDRYYKPLVQVTSENSNPWVISENPPPTVKATNWNAFATAITSKLTAPASENSDVASAIGHAVTILQEYHDKRVRKILLLCTDGLDSYRQLPTVPADIEVIAVGILPDNQIEQALHTANVKRYESLQAAIDFLSSVTF